MLSRLPALLASACLALGGLGAVGAAARASAAPRPNVILILADDLGYECLGANGGTSYRTPVLDQLAATGVRFEQCHVQPLCTPTRVQVMTGIYNVRNYVDFGRLDPSATTFGHLFKAAGYATCIAGKWQLGAEADLPKKSGFDEYCLWDHFRHPSRYKNPGLEINGVARDWTNGEYGPDLVNDYAIDFITRKRTESFLLYYPMMLTHSPYDATPDSPGYREGSRDKKVGSSRNFGDMVAYMDKLVGKLLTRLDELGLRDNTFVLFLGDNGTGAGTISMMGDRQVVGAKGSTTAAGMHVPLIAHWPGRIPGGRVSADLIDSTDILPTICEAAGVKLSAASPIDGRSFFPQLRGEPGRPRDWYYCWYGRNGVLEREFAANRAFKLYRDGSFFDLRTDLAEANPLRVTALTGERREAAQMLQGVLDQYQNARPAHLLRATKPKKAKG